MTAKEKHGICFQFQNIGAQDLAEVARALKQLAADVEGFLLRLIQTGKAVNNPSQNSGKPWRYGLTSACSRRDSDMEASGNTIITSRATFTPTSPVSVTAAMRRTEHDESIFRPSCPELSLCIPGEALGA